MIAPPRHREHGVYRKQKTSNEEGTIEIGDHVFPIQSDFIQSDP
jgi:hypothetical protein